MSLLKALILKRKGKEQREEGQGGEGRGEEERRGWLPLETSYQIDR